MVGAGKAKVREIKYKDVTKAKKKSPSNRRAKREGLQGENQGKQNWQG